MLLLLRLWWWLGLGEGVRKREGLMCLDLCLGVFDRREWEQGQGMLEVGEVVWVSSVLVGVGVESGKVW